MVKLPPLAVYALLAPAITLGAASALATDTPAELAGAKDQRTTQEHREVPGNMPGQAENEEGMSTLGDAREQRRAAVRAQHGQQSGETYLSSAPADSIRADDLIGSTLKSQSQDEDIGTISDLILDEDGQIVAVVVETGDFMGLGEKNIAVSWDAIDRSSNEQGDGYDLSVDATEDALKDAPAFETDAKQY